MGRNLETTKKLRVPIEESLISFGSGYEIGPRLRHCQNFARNYVRNTGIPQFPFGVPDVPTANGAVLQFDAAGANGMGFWISDGAFFFVGANQVAGPNARHIWDVGTGVIVPVIGAALGNGVVAFPWSFAFAPNIAEPTTFVVNQASPKKKIHDDGAGTPELVDYAPTFDPDGTPDFSNFPRVCYYHLNRLWIVYPSTLTRRSLVFFSDPLTPDIIRGDSFIDIPDDCVAVFRASASDIDIGAQAHLIFGCKGGMFILDGDPTLGNAVFRQMKKNFGIFSANHVVETSEGAIFLATDNRIYLLPRGAMEPIPISDSVREKFVHLESSLRMGYRFPYLYVLDNPGERVWMCDLSDVRRGPYWTGPHTGLPAMKGFISDVPSSLVSYIPVFEPIQIATLFPAGANKLLRTGYVFEEDSDVVFARAWFDFRQFGVERTATFRVFNPLGLQEEFQLTIPAFAGVPTSDTIAKVRVIAQPQLAEFGDFFWMELEGITLTDIRNWHIEYRVEPRKD